MLRMVPLPLQGRNENDAETHPLPRRCRYTGLGLDHRLHRPVGVIIKPRDRHRATSDRAALVADRQRRIVQEQI